MRCRMKKRVVYFSIIASGILRGTIWGAYRYSCED